MERVKREDTVQVMRGKDASGGDEGRGKRARVVRVHPDEGTALVEGVNVVTRHEPVQRTRRGDKSGGIQNVERPVHLSNVMPVCPSCDKATRVGFVYETEGDRRSKVRACKRCDGTF